MTLPERSSSTPNRTVWVEIDEKELAEVRKAIVLRIAELDQYIKTTVVAIEQTCYIRRRDRARAVLARIPTDAAMTRHYP